MKTMIAYSGAVRNWKTLCDELDVDSSLSQREIDQNIVMKSYDKWGYSMGNHIHGGFAAVIWDDEEKQLFCVRDPLGIKVFYYYITVDGKLLFGMSIKEIMRQDGFIKQLNEAMLPLYLSLTYPAGEETFFKGIKKLMPGCYLLWHKGYLQIEKYYMPKFTADISTPPQEWVKEIHNTLIRIMNEMKTDNQEVAFLSGGVDSSYVFALSSATNALTASYGEKEFDEAKEAKETAAFLQRACLTNNITPEKYFSMVPYVMYHMEQPLADASAVVFAISCQEAAKYAGTCYSGEGADELFGGYPDYGQQHMLKLVTDEAYVSHPELFNEDEKKALLKNYGRDMLTGLLASDIYKVNYNQGAVAKMMAIDIGLWLEGNIFLSVERMSEAAGLHIKMPIADRRMLDLAVKIPTELNVRDGKNKILFRLAAEKVLPQEIAFRKKRGFPVPLRKWLQDERWNKKVLETLHSSVAAHFFHLREIDRIWSNYQQGNQGEWQKIWNIYTFLVWYIEYFEHNHEMSKELQHDEQNMG